MDTTQSIGLLESLALLPLNKINGGLFAGGQAGCPSKIEAMNEAYRLIDSGLMTLADFQNAVGLTTHVDKSVVNISNKSIESLERLTNITASELRVATRAIVAQDEKSAKLERSLDALQSVYLDVDETVRNSLASIRGVESRVDALNNLLGRPAVDPAVIEQMIAERVGNAFSAFKEVSKPERLNEVAHLLPIFRRVRAGDLFESTTYNCNDRTVDFSDLMIGVWDSPEAPVSASDYIFDPEHLHQVLIALDDPLPDNVWLAGERGTGKTEFVNQVASRLGRKVFRVNFDEALERADFIGANTIQDGSVVWKAGIIAQAIQQAGAIVLLDEVGFARAQSISVLHALTERSANRGLVVNETGEKILVASYVAFFACDNSNGHGDASGNFAGVRDQNTAFLDRFGYTLEFNYLPSDKEVSLLTSRTGIAFDQAQSLVQFANVARKSARNGTLTQPPSLRQLFALSRAIVRGVPVILAFKSTIINKFPSECEPELLGVFNSTIKLDIF
jgi:cobaltochelatase CobS